MCPSGTTQRGGENGRSEFRSAFDALDADHDGKISREDLRTFYVGFPGKASATEEEDMDIIGTMMSVADSNKDGFVEYDEFERVLNPTRRREGGGGGGGGVMEDVFKVMDKDGDGKLSHEDLKSYMNMAGFSASDEDIKAMIILGGGDENQGGVTYDGLLKILAFDSVN